MKKLKRRLEELFRKGEEFVRNIKNGEKVILIYDSDVDGVSSAYLMLSALEKFGKKVDATLACSWGKLEKIKKRIKNFDKIITVDVPVDLIEKNFLQENKKMLIIDHHPCDDLNSENIILINPRLEKSWIYQPTSYVIYKMFNFLKEKEWVASLGTVGDFGIDDCKDLIRVKDKKNIWKTKYGKASVLVGNAISVLGAESVLEMFLKAKDLKDLIRRREIINASKKFEEELKNSEKEFFRNLEIVGDVWISEVKPVYAGICSALITQLSTKNPEKIIFLLEEGKNNVKIHGRCGSKKVNIGFLFKKLGIGGGHEAAGAGIINKKDKNKLKIEILEELRDFTRIKR
ncbi:MAG: DHH family phosphoesterase [Candidatus Aenigmatarchaeota archaeon]